MLFFISFLLSAFFLMRNLINIVSLIGGSINNFNHLGDRPIPLLYIILLGIWIIARINKIVSIPKMSFIRFDPHAVHTWPCDLEQIRYTITWGDSGQPLGIP
jgi:hypothetical protein